MEHLQTYLIKYLRKRARKVHNQRPLVQLNLVEFTLVASNVWKPKYVLRNKQHEGLIHTRHFCTQYCDIAIKRYCDNWSHRFLCQPR